MGRAPCCSKVGLHKGPWTPKEDALLTKYIQAHGEGQWKSLPKKAGRLPGRTDNEIKNYWNTHLSKKLKNQGSDEANTLGNPPQEPPKKKKNSGKKSKNNKRKNKGTTDTNNADEAPTAKTQVYLPKPIRVKAMYLARTDSNTFTFDSNSPSGSSSQEELKEESPVTKESNMVCEVGNEGESDGFGFFSVDHDLVNASDIECQSYFHTEDHGTLQKVYEEYFQLLNMDHAQFDFNSYDDFFLE
ncbi:hypothetical protein Fmac_010674 [Flemingia macrophylla]|uniref:Uncharacterized protein n=1 Tax=Flemingia macrophylla TaxID=520843 RepID=A0ABD1ML30_9FABA